VYPEDGPLWAETSELEVLGLKYVGAANVNKVMLIIKVCISRFFLCEMVILVPGHEQDKVYD
jgi:hypothetical protein